MTSTRSVAASARDVSRARWATAVVFFVHGCVVGNFASRLPWIAAHVGVGLGGLGLALLMPGFGAMLAAPFAGRLAHSFSYRPLVTVTIVAWCASLELPALPSSYPLLFVALFAFGATAGFADMAMNAHGTLIERLLRRSIMSNLHGFWSLGVLGGSIVSAVATHLGLDARIQFIAVAAALAVAGSTAARELLDDAAPAADEAPPRFSLPSRPVLCIGLVGLCCVFAEQAGTDWSALFVRHELHGSASVAAFAVSAFAVTMATTRLLGDHAVRRFGPVPTVRLSGVCAALGALAVVLAHSLAVGLIGFALLGAGVAVVVPLVFAAAGRIGPHPARSVAGAVGVSYGSGLLAPGIIGGIASAASLRAAFILIVALVLVVSLSAGLLSRYDS